MRLLSKYIFRISLALLILTCYQISGQEQTKRKLTIDSLAFNEIAQLEESGKKDEAALVFVEYLEKRLKVEPEKRLFAEMVQRYAAYQQSITKNPEYRKRYFDVLVNARASVKPADTLALIDAYYTAANDANQMIRYNVEALDYINKGIALWEDRYEQPTDLYAQMNFQKAAILDHLFYKGEAYEQFEKTISIYESVENVDKMFLFGFYKNCSNQFSSYGFYDKAELYLNKASDLVKDIRDRLKKIERERNELFKLELELAYNYAALYYRSSNEEKLIKTIEQMDRFSEGKDLSQIAQSYKSAAYNTTGMFFSKTLKDDKEALRYFEMALNTAPKNYIQFYVDYYELNIAKTKLLLGDEEGANLILNKLEKQNLQGLLTMIYSAMKGEILLNKGEVKEALPYINDVVNEIAVNQETLQVLSDSVVDKFYPSKDLTKVEQLEGLARKFSELERQSDTTLIVANHLYRLAFKQFNNTYTKSDYNEKLQGMFNTILKGIIKTNKQRYCAALPDKSLLEIVIKKQSDFLWHDFLVNRDIEALKIPDSLVKKEEEYFKRLTFFEEQIKLNKKDSILQLKANDLKEKIRILRDHLKSNFASYDYLNAFDFNLEQFQNELNNQQVLLNYLVLDNSLFLAKITSSNIEIYELGPYIEIEEAIAAYLRSLDDITIKKASIIEQAEYLSSKLGINLIDEKTEVIIIPDKIIHYLPFETLATNGDYLIKSLSISYAIAVPFINFRDVSVRDSGTPLVFAPSYKTYELNTQKLAFRNVPKTLKGTITEAKTISDIIGGRLFMNEQATKGKFLDEVNDSNLLHLAMHAYLDEENSSLSSLVFSDSNDDYNLYISELYGMKLNADIAVLSACNTGIGLERSGKGVISLNRAFTYAGVPTTISSLWSIPDNSTKEIMTNFYKNIDEGSTTSEALRHSKLDYLNSVAGTKQEHPLFWAGLIHQGKNTTVDLNNTSALWLVIIFICLLTVIWFLYARFAKRNK